MEHIRAPDNRARAAATVACAALPAQEAPFWPRVQSAAKQ